MKKIVSFLKRNVVMAVALVLATVTVFFVPPDREYLSYFDLRTLSCLFCSLAVICALKNIGFFRIVAERVVMVFKTKRMVVLALVYITFIGSMLIANDMALLTFLPLGFFVVSSTDNRKSMAFVFIMQNIAANLGGMLTPFGNPQNLYLYSYFNIPTARFMGIMLLPFLISVGLITLCCFIFVGNAPMVLKNPENGRLPRVRTAVYLALFAYAIFIVFRIVPYWTGLILIPLALLLLDRKALRMVDYPLLITFCAFFVFSGNLARVPQISSALSAVVSKNTLLSGVVSCQLISNVPSAILLSKFTDNYRQLLVAVNIGGTGTLIASLASLITFREFTSHEPRKSLSYVLEFSAFNFSFLALLTFTMLFIYR